MKNFQLLKTYLSDLYLDFDFSELFELLGNLPEANVKESNSEWYKTFNLYVTYPDSFEENNRRDFTTLTKQLKRIKTLGFSSIHVLPFLDSPLIDAGFDVRDYKKVREDLGGNESFDKFLVEAKSENLHIFIDFVLNHISNQHEWFQKAIDGDENYRNFFCAFEQKPELLNIEHRQSGYVAKYNVNNESKDIPLIFPELTADRSESQALPNFYQAKDGFYYFHTFYPEQIDLNWANPKVFLEMAKILIYWAQKGVNFRLDAIQFLGKNFAIGIFTDSEMTHRIIKALSEIVSLVNPEIIFLAEAPQEIAKVLKYFGGAYSPEAKMVYDFELTAILWLSLLTEDFTKLIAYLNSKSSLNLPNFAQWLIFLRNHDELLLELIDENSRKIILERLAAKGLEFKKGYGISGRTASFLDDDDLVLAYALLCSLPGCPALIYGDEFAMKNDILNMLESRDKKQQAVKNHAFDTRDINRGPINSDEPATESSMKISPAISNIFNLKAKFPETYTNSPTIKPSGQKGALYLIYKLKSSKELHCVINLSENSFKFELAYSEIILKVNEVKFENVDILLPEHSAVWLLK